MVGGSDILLTRGPIAPHGTSLTEKTYNSVEHTYLKYLYAGKNITHSFVVDALNSTVRTMHYITYSGISGPSEHIMYVKTENIRPAQRCRANATPMSPIAKFYATK